MDKGFKYFLETEKILEYMKLPDEDKLRWLEEVRQFNKLVLDDRTKKIREKLRKAEV